MHNIWRAKYFILETNSYNFRSEANDQYLRDKQVEAAIVNILSNRVTDCIQYNLSGLDRDDPNNACQGVKVNLVTF